MPTSERSIGQPERIDSTRPQPGKHITLPLAAIVLAAILLNVGLYTQLKPVVRTLPSQLPFRQSFDETISLDAWPRYGSGLWSVDGGAVVQSQSGSDETFLFLPLRLSSGEGYRVEVDLQFGANIQSAGIAFNGQYPNISQNHHSVLIQKANDRSTIIAGLVIGENYEQQAIADLAPAPEVFVPTRLTVEMGPQGYSVWVDDVLALQDVPLEYEGGMVGLIATGGPVSFDSLQITSTTDSVNP